MDGIHNLISIIEPTASYMTTWGNPFPIPPRPPALNPPLLMPGTLLVRDYPFYDVAKRAAAKLIHDTADKIWYWDLCHTQSFYTMSLPNNCLTISLPIVVAFIPMNWSTYQQTCWDIMPTPTVSPSILICLRKPNKNWHVPISPYPIINSLPSPPSQCLPPNTSHTLLTNG